jgi:hypothetical protein
MAQQCQVNTARGRVGPDTEVRSPGWTGQAGGRQGRVSQPYMSEEDGVG